ncbi:MAG: APC family permease [Nitrososphaera sp.]|uniref:APC family permease n=1 Tax=Nitrososphaera sp. TaxID=1971748 RepID=UPI00183E825A|nr:APC family permease [Nitrososphaera sp.]NWG36831.1 amino acid permease [Nitrososphaera sp.]
MTRNAAAAGAQLRKSIGLFQAVMYGTGLILGAGIYVLIGDVAGIAGNATWISFALAAAIAAFTGLSYAELSSMFPKSAAEYVFVKNAFGSNLFAFVAGWLIIFVAIVSAAAVAIGFAGYFASFVPQADRLLAAVALVAVLSAVNFIGIRESTWTNAVFAIIEVAGLATIIGAGLFLGSPGSTDYYEMPPSVTSLPVAFGAIVGAAGLIFFAYFGFENLANIAEETKNARRTIPVALVVSIAVTTVIYILVAVSAVALVGWEALSQSDAPLAFAAEKAFGRVGVIMLASIGLFATTNTVLMLLVAGSRIIFGMAADRALPFSLSTIHPKTRTPARAVIAAMVLTAAVVAVSSGRIDAVARVAVFGIFMVYTLVNLSLIWLRYKKPDLERPFRTPGTIGRFPILAGLGLATSLWMLTQFDWMTAAAGVAAAGSAVLFYRPKR